MLSFLDFFKKKKFLKTQKKKTQRRNDMYVPKMGRAIRNSNAKTAKSFDMAKIRNWQRGRKTEHALAREIPSSITLGELEMACVWRTGKGDGARNGMNAGRARDNAYDIGMGMEWNAGCGSARCTARTKVEQRAVPTSRAQKNPRPKPGDEFGLRG